MMARDRIVQPKPAGQRRKEAMEHGRHVAQFYHGGLIARELAVGWVLQLRADGWETAASDLLEVIVCEDKLRQKHAWALRVLAAR